VSKLPPYALLLATLCAVVAVVVAQAPTTIVACGTPALLAVLTSTRGRRTFARRLIATAPLLVVALLLRWLEHAPTRELLLPALRVASAVAWASCLSTWLAPPALHAALRSLGAPSAFVELIAHTRRFAIQLVATASDAWNAATLRAGTSSARATLGTVGQVAGVIVVRAFDRAECVAIAGALRGRDFAEETSLEESLAAPSQGFPR